ncbi:MAG: hypothetical protein IPP26_03845 [Flavobacteriales bacterium]|nr:hypothetical protein [Flavobacteriales bacterium]
MRNLLLLLILFRSLLGSAQGVDSVRTIPGNFDLFTTDELGNVYALKGDELKLFNPEGKSWLRNSLKTFGRITHIDVFQSLKPLVFAAEQGQLAMLDNTLAVQGSVINLPREGYPQVDLACASVQNYFWFFDPRELQLIRVNSKLSTVNASGRLDQLLGFTPRPVQMQELDNWLYMNDPAHGILVFDLFATYYKTIPITGATGFEVRGNDLWYVKDSVLHRYDRLTFASEHFPLPGVGTVRDARIERGRVYILREDRIEIVQLGR